ncbi:lipopolysaccharide biosynthesis protein [Bacteroides graminisolvens]|uniref:lipopolysaccharide biosynthesis protein n=1 Tax=Bacteroides graminisolvens TaxID=477666 RepID=UPI0023F4FB28|nr:lipopolysaccharide biosynthesis protein [Bacteroides graminisolvens]
MSNIKKELFSGVFYTAVAKYSGIVISLAVTAVLSRLLSPDDFGIVAIATVIISFFSIFTDMGIGAAVIQHKELTPKDLSSLYSFTLWSGISISLLFFMASWPIAAWYNSPILRTLCQLLSINLLFASANIVPNALISKNKEFKFIAWRSFIIQTSTGVLAIGVALAGAGLYALIVNPILSSIFIFIISYRKYPQKVSFTWGLHSVKKIFSYSAYQFLFNVINYFSRNLDKLLIGKYMNMSQLGYYEKSYRLMMLPLQNITQVITPVMHPIFSDYQKDLDQLATSYEKIIRFLAFIGLPLSMFLFFGAREITLIIFGDQWMPSVPVFQILSLSVGVQIILSSSGSIFQAAGDTRSLFICGVFSSALNVTGMLVGIFVFGTLEALAACICITFLINFIQCYLQMYYVTLQKRKIVLIGKQLLSPLLLSALIFIALQATSIYADKLPILVSITMKGIVFIVIFGCYIQYTKEYDLVGKLKSKLKR